MKLNIPVTMKVEVSPIERLFKHLKVKEVRGYCSNCHNYEKNYSCPGFSFNTDSYISDYKYAAVIMTQMDTMEFGEHMEQIKFSDVRSAVYDRYTDARKKAEEEAQHNKISAIAMYAFNMVKDEMTDKLLKYETRAGSIGLPPGSCTRCDECMKLSSNDCVHPDKLRYSLEALGFLVSDIYRDYFDRELEFSGGVLPKAFYTCSAVLSKEPIDKTTIHEAIDDLSIELMIEDQP